MSNTITFLDQTFNRDELTDTLINYIETYNTVMAAPRSKGPNDRDYQFRMNQALQMFGDEEVVAGINLLILQESGG